MPKHRLRELSALRRLGALGTTVITTALENARIEDVQKVAVHRDPETTKLYDRHLLPTPSHGPIASGASR